MSSNKGAILIVTLWTLLILSVLAAGMAFRLSLDARLSLYFLDELRAESIAKAGLFRAMDLLHEDIDDFDSLFECGIRLKPDEKPAAYFENIPLGDGAFNVGYEQDGRYFFGLSDEDRRINLNLAGENILTTLLMSLGEVREVSDAREMAYNIIDWRDADHASSIQMGAEDGYYESLSRPYECADRPFHTVEELLLVKDITPEIYKKIQDHVTVYGEGNQLQINLNTAPLPVLRVLAMSVGISKDNAERLAQRIAGWRAGADGEAGTEDDLALTAVDIQTLEVRLPDLTSLAQANMIPTFKNFFKSYSSYYRIESTGTVNGSAVRKKLTVVVRKKNDEGRPVFAYYHS